MEPQSSNPEHLDKHEPSPGEMSWNPKDYFDKLWREPENFANQDGLKVIYVFAGHRRRADVREHLQHFAATLGFTLRMREFDILMDEKIMMC